MRRRIREVFIGKTLCGQSLRWMFEQVEQDVDKELIETPFSKRPLRSSHIMMRLMRFLLPSFSVYSA